MIKAGSGRREITPPLGIELAGYGYYLARKACVIRCMRAPSMWKKTIRAF